MSNDCIFCRIAAGDIPADLVLEDEEVVAFRDTNPQAPTHVLVIPRRHVASAHELDDPGLTAALFAAMRRIADAEGLGDGYRIVTNIGPAAGQSVAHLHFHLLGGRSLAWPPG
ncbi:MAG TPA: histidine triad nucleotide-binding protein [Candidatus Limnocylindria bacterium]|jgi:histidine triad (HIT) family protein|nr:histidine triad nucleotide-binding protein [Candidatus Limnocylindria bacterium]